MWQKGNSGHIKNGIVIIIVIFSSYDYSCSFAFRLLQEFVEKRGSGLEVVYTLSGWLKNDPQVYHISLVCEPKLAG